MHFPALKLYQTRFHNNSATDLFKCFASIDRKVINMQPTKELNKATDYGPNGQGSIPFKGSIFLIAVVSRPAPESTQPRV